MITEQPPMPRDHLSAELCTQGAASGGKRTTCLHELASQSSTHVDPGAHGRLTLPASAHESAFRPGSEAAAPPAPTCRQLPLASEGQDRPVEGQDRPEPPGRSLPKLIKAFREPCAIFMARRPAESPTVGRIEPSGRLGPYTFLIDNDCSPVWPSVFIWMAIGNHD